MVQVQICSCDNHKYYGSPFPRDQVPVEQFKCPNSDCQFQMCTDCRGYKTEHKRQNREALKNTVYDKFKVVITSMVITIKYFVAPVEIVDPIMPLPIAMEEPSVLSILPTDPPSPVEPISSPKFKRCSNKKHSKNSPFPRDHVPIEKFFKNNPNCHPHETCIECRLANNERNRRLIEGKINNVPPDHFFCHRCRKTYPMSKCAKNSDGSDSSRCEDCIDYDKEYREKLANHCLKKKKEIIAKNGYCCEKCECIFVNLKSDTKKWMALNTYMEGNQRMMSFQDQVMTVDHFLAKYSDEIAYCLLEFDHLPLNEQEARNVPVELRCKKYKNMSKITDTKDMDLEVQRCQLVCKHCHVLETQRREKGIVRRKPQLEQDKCDLVAARKRDGCEMCGMKCDNHRMFDMDHLNPKTKIDRISNLVKDRKCSISKFKKELNTTRVLCKHCHAIFTIKDQDRPTPKRTNVIIPKGNRSIKNGIIREVQPNRVLCKPYQHIPLHNPVRIPNEHQSLNKIIREVQLNSKTCQQNHINPVGIISEE